MYACVRVCVVAYITSEDWYLFLLFSYLMYYKTETTNKRAWIGVSGNRSSPHDVNSSYLLFFVIYPVLIDAHKGVNVSFS